jgi:gamma-glutamylcyclotransferase
MSRLIAWMKSVFGFSRETRMPAVEQQTGDRFLYFGYGSNMLSVRLQRRTPSARMYATGHVTGRRLTFHKKSDDRSGKGDAEATGNDEDRVEGVLFWIDRAEKPALDDAEGLDRGYEEAMVDVITANATVKALAYVASAGATDPARRPYHWYKRLVLAGAIEHGLPAATIAAIRAVASQDDPRPNRPRKLEAEEALAASGIVID